jgi:hypothetical protein
MDIKEMGQEDVEWINMTQEKDKWRAFVNTVLKYGCNKLRKIS